MAHDNYKQSQLPAFEGAHVYLPESAKSAFWINRYDVVISAFSVITDIPPLGES